MDNEISNQLLRQIMWDYNIPPEELFEVLNGRKETAGHFNRETIMIRLLESYPWFTILELFTPEELRDLITDNVVRRLRFKSLRKRYEFIQKRLYQTVPAAD